MAEPVRDDVFAMPKTDGEGLVRALLTSVAPDTDDARRSAAEFTAELRRRIDDLDSGKEAVMGLDEVMARLRARSHVPEDGQGSRSEE
jgi:putative addiction module component (TIGR02574 family)